MDSQVHWPKFYPAKISLPTNRITKILILQTSILVWRYHITYHHLEDRCNHFLHYPVMGTFHEAIDEVWERPGNKTVCTGSANTCSCSLVMASRSSGPLLLQGIGDSAVTYGVYLPGDRDKIKNWKMSNFSIDKLFCLCTVVSTKEKILK